MITPGSSKMLSSIQHKNSHKLRNVKVLGPIVILAVTLCVTQCQAAQNEFSQLDVPNTAEYRRHALKAQDMENWVEAHSEANVKKFIAQLRDSLRTCPRWGQAKADGWTVNKSYTDRQSMWSHKCDHCESISALIEKLQSRLKEDPEMFHTAAVAVAESLLYIPHEDFKRSLRSSVQRAVDYINKLPYDSKARAAIGGEERFAGLKKSNVWCESLCTDILSQLKVPIMENDGSLKITHKIYVDDMSYSGTQLFNIIVNELLEVKCDDDGEWYAARLIDDLPQDPNHIRVKFRKRIARPDLRSKIVDVATDDWKESDNNACWNNEKRRDSEKESHFHVCLPFLSIGVLTRMERCINKLKDYPHMKVHFWYENNLLELGQRYHHASKTLVNGASETMICTKEMPDGRSVKFLGNLRKIVENRGRNGENTEMEILCELQKDTMLIDNNQILGQPLVYFDHKIANHVSVSQLFFQGYALYNRLSGTGKNLVKCISRKEENECGWSGQPRKDGEKACPACDGETMVVDVDGYECEWSQLNVDRPALKDVRCYSDKFFQVGGPDHPKLEYYKRDSVSDLVQSRIASIPLTHDGEDKSSDTDTESDMELGGNTPKSPGPTITLTDRLSTLERGQLHF